MNKVAWIIFSAAVVVLIGGLVIWSQISNPRIDVSNVDSNAIVAASAQNGEIADHTLGKTDAKVVLVEYGDFQCPSCGGAHPQVKLVMEEYKDKVLFIFRNFPLTTIHPNARAAAAAVEAAGLQGKYWQMHDAIFENQNQWTNLTGTQRTDQFVQFANTLGLDTARFTEDLSAETVNKKISFDQAMGKKLDVSATPTFYLNGEKIDDATSSAIVRGDAQVLRDALDKALAQ